MTDNAAETPLTELMARIPRGEALAWYESHGSGAYCHAPVGEYVHRALALIAAQAAEIAALQKDLVRYNEPSPLYAENERLREKVRLARMLSARLHLIHDDGRYVSVWTLSANAGRPYNGPTYEAELAALDAVLTPEERQP